MSRLPYLLLLVFSSLGLSNSYAAQDDFGLSTTVVTTSVVKKVKKKPWQASSFHFNKLPCFGRRCESNDTGHEK